jgi:hypothetical protein
VFSWMQKNPWEETREGRRGRRGGEAGGSHSTGEEGGDVRAGWGAEEKVMGEAGSPKLQMGRAAPCDLAGAGGSEGASDGSGSWR